MILGVPGKLQSQFRLTYNMILNLLRVEALRVEEMIKRSFSENASQRLLPEQQKKVIEVSYFATLIKPVRFEDVQHEKALSVLRKLDCDVCLPEINTYYSEMAEMVHLNQRLLNMAVSHPQGARTLVGGRVVILRDGVRIYYLFGSCVSSLFSISELLRQLWF
jgi:antiviral helicase SKI2